jgi:soluble lytic murein transglycosylase-like protein
MVRMAPPQRALRDGLNAPPRTTVPPVSLSDGQRSAFDALARSFNPSLTAAQSAEIGAAILSASRAHGLDPRFLSSIIAVESGFNIYSLSPSGAMGLGQLMPFNLRSLGVSNAWNPTQNIHGAARHLRQSLNEYNGRADATLLAVAAYNAGGGAVRRAGYRVPGGGQVQRYVWKVYNQYKAFAPELFASR